MPRRPRPLTEHDRAVWLAYASRVQALPGRTPPVPAAEPIQARPSPTELSAPVSRPRPLPATVVTGLHPPGLDRASWHRFSSGKLPAARTLDLHGKTAQAAFLALERFLHAAALEQLRCVEIITGRGSGEAGGVIRRELPLWLNRPELRSLVLAAAHPHAFNQGATRLLLRRNRLK